MKTKLIYSLLLGVSAAALSGTFSAAMAETSCANGQELINGSCQSVETVVVTGSLIPRASMGDTATPTVVIDASTIKATGYGNIANVLVQVPAIQFTSSTQNTNFLTSGAGISNINQYELGANRTLVLVNGRRWVTGSPTSTAVDLNTIPTELIDHVETITGGSSAVYGSDAVAGVVNIILKDDFEGITASGQYGSTSRNDGADQLGSLLLGGNFLDGKGNMTLSMSYEKSDAVFAGSRSLSQTDATHFPGLFPCFGTVGCIFLGGSSYSSFAPAGRFQFANATDTNTISGSYNPDGSPFSTPVDGFDRNPNRLIQVPLIRRNIDEVGHLQLLPWLRVFAEGTYSATTSSSQIEPYPGGSSDGLSKPTSAGGQGILIPLSNPFIPAGLLANDPGGSPGLWFSRRFGDLGDRTTSVDRSLARTALGFEGDYGALAENLSMLKDWTWKLSYVWGRSTESQTDGGYYDKIKMQYALNARLPTGAEVAPVGGGGYVCDDPIAQTAGCVPINLFGAGTITPEASKYVSALLTLQDKATEQDVNIQTGGSLFDLWGAGAIQMAVGAEYREESASFIPDSGSQNGTVAGNQIPATSGSYMVHELFGELNVPLLKDLPFAKSVGLDFAGRYSDYNTSGGTTSWNISGNWQVIDDFKLRGNFSTSVRAPNIAELFSPAAQTFPGISADICAAPSSANEIANCATDILTKTGSSGTPTYGGSTGLAAKQGVGGYQSGNPDLSPETAHSVTAGFVLRPHWVNNLQFTMDYYQISVNGFIGGLDTQTTQQACYDSDPSGYSTNVFCQQIIRQIDPVLGPIIKQINFPSFNLGSIKTSGVDASLSYAMDLANLAEGLENAGTLAFTLDANYVHKYDTDPGVPGTSVIHSGGDAGVQKWRGTMRGTYTNGPLATTLSLRYIGPASVAQEDFPDSSPPADDIPSVWYTDLNVAYDFTGNIEGYFGAHNLFDVQPPETFIGSGLDDTGTGTLTTNYDPIGLFLYAGMTFKM